MAKLKKLTETEGVVNEQPVVANEEIKQAESPKPTKSKEEKKDVKAISENIPEHALSILKVFSKHAELMVTPQGGVFSPGSKLGLEKGAILYKNPYYNN